MDGNYNVLNFKRVDGKYWYVIIGNWSGELNVDGNIEGKI